MYHNFFIHSSVDGHLGCFHVLAIVYSAAMSNGYMGLLELGFSQGICPVVGLQGHMVDLGFPGGSDGKKSSCNVGDLGSIPGLGRSPGEGKGYPLQCSGLENSMRSQRLGHD